MCFFFILGVVPRERRIGTETRFCSFEGRETVHVLIERRMWFMLFFIPVFPVSRKEIIAECTSCGLASREQIELEQEAFRPVGRGLKICPNCGAEVVEEARFCQYCGQRLL